MKSVYGQWLGFFTSLLMRTLFWYVFDLFGQAPGWLQETYGGRSSVVSNASYVVLHIRQLDFNVNTELEYMIYYIMRDAYSILCDNMKLRVKQQFHQERELSSVRAWGFDHFEASSLPLSQPVSNPVLSIKISRSDRIRSALDQGFRPGLLGNSRFSSRCCLKKGEVLIFWHEIPKVKWSSLSWFMMLTWHAFANGNPSWTVCQQLDPRRADVSERALRL